MAGNALSLFQAEELEALVNGSPEAFDADQIQLCVRYESGFTQEHPTILLFWKYFKALSPQRQRQWLHFLTGSDRIPATGTHSLQLRFTCSGSDQERLPSSHTCFSQLVFPSYETLNVLRTKFDQAIDLSEGFGLR